MVAVALAGGYLDFGGRYYVVYTGTLAGFIFIYKAITITITYKSTFLNTRFFMHQADGIVGIYI